ncbi:hypothetical protein DL766_005717 [Monosporascus sp. MC13-8B]|nr:hypothetical protein DL763_006853 [Monosporascus cannonballus]RYP28758.1 hypothetical protein DL766_005717 [Monosporascus sp. MC13-8B]
MSQTIAVAAQPVDMPCLSGTTALSQAPAGPPPPSPGYHMSLAIPSVSAASDSSDVALNSSIDQDLRARFRPLPRPSYAQGAHAIDIQWECYIEKHNFRQAFLKLRGTQRDRYGCIIERTEAEEANMEGHIKAVILLLKLAKQKLSQTSRSVVQAAPVHRTKTPGQSLPADEATPRAKVPRGRPRKHPLTEGTPALASTDAIPQGPDSPSGASQQGHAQNPTPQLNQYNRKNLVEDGIVHLGDYLDFPHPYTHKRRYPEFLKHKEKTKYGEVTVVMNLDDQFWYMGHKPGEHVFRILYPEPVAPVTAYFDLTEPLFEYDDSSLGYDYDAKYEGIVPFSMQEYRQRFEESVFPTFITIIIAALCFDADPEYSDMLVSSLRDLHEALTHDNPSVELALAKLDENRQEHETQSMKMLAEQRAVMKRHVNTLFKIWKSKYSDCYAQLPTFLKSQLRESKSRITETASLIHIFSAQLVDNPVGMSSASGVWTECVGFLNAMTGQSVEQLAARYTEEVLKPEAMEQLEDDNEHWDVLFYSSQICPMSGDIYSFYDTDKQIGYYQPFPEQTLRELRTTAEKILTPRPTPTPAPSRRPQRKPTQPKSSGKKAQAGSSRGGVANDIIVVAGAESVKKSGEHKKVQHREGGLATADKSQAELAEPRRKRKRGAASKTNAKSRKLVTPGPSSPDPNERKVESEFVVSG